MIKGKMLDYLSFLENIRPLAEYTQDFNGIQTLGRYSEDTVTTDGLYNMSFAIYNTNIYKCKLDDPLAEGIEPSKQAQNDAWFNITRPSLLLSYVVELSADMDINELAYLTIPFNHTMNTDIKLEYKDTGGTTKQDSSDVPNYSGLMPYGVDNAIPELLSVTFTNMSNGKIAFKRANELIDEDSDGVTDHYRLSHMLSDMADNGATSLPTGTKILIQFSNNVSF